MATKGGNGVIHTKEKRGIRLENPFTLKVGQVFTGFGIGCGAGIGVGRPLNLGTFCYSLCVQTHARAFLVSTITRQERFLEV